MHGGVDGAEERVDGMRDLAGEEAELGSRWVFNIVVFIFG